MLLFRLMQKLLLPFSFLYGIITDIRNFLYNSGFWKEFTFNIPVINVGNLTVGGTGKTPHVEYLIRLLKDQYVLTTLSRGYGRKTQGFIMADSTDNAQTIGDEPYQFYQKFSNQIGVAVGESRAEAIIKILNQKPNNEIIILDDAFQHRSVKPSLNLLLMDYSRPIHKDYTFPAGRLREKRHGAKRADAVIITKCPVDLPAKKHSDIEKNLQPYLTPDTPVFFTKIVYGKPQNCRSENGNKSFKRVILVSGIANPQSFEAYATTQFDVVAHVVFNDHHEYIEKDLWSIKNKNYDDETVILMTEKDMVKFIPFLNHALLNKIELYYLPIAVEFLTQQMKEKFEDLIKSHCKR